MDPTSSKQQSSTFTPSKKPEDTHFTTTIYDNAVVPLQKYVTALAVSPVGDKAVLAGKKGLFIVDLDKLYETPKTLKITKQNIWDITSVKWSKTPNLIATSSHQMISIWDLNNEKMAQQSQLQAHRRPITDMNWSPFQQHLLATCSTDSYVFLWDIRDPNNPLKGKYFRAYSGGATQVKWSKLNPMHLVASHSGEVRIWDLRSDTPLETIHAETVDIVSLDTSPQHEALILTATQNNTIKFWSFEKPRECQGVLVTSQPLSKVKFIPFGWGVIALSSETDPSLELYSLMNTSLVTNFGSFDSSHRTSHSIGPIQSSNTIIHNYFGLGPTPSSTVTKDQTETFKIGQSRPLDAVLVHNFGRKNQSISVFDWRVMLINEHPEIQLITLSRKDSTLRLHAIDSSWQELCGYKVSVQARRKSISIGGYKHFDSEKTSLQFTTDTNERKSSNIVNTNASSVNVNNSRIVQNSNKTTTILTLENEFRQILDSSIPGIIIEKVNPSQRYLICTAKRGKFMVQVKITFPTLYPRMAPPAFEMLSNISPQSKVKIKEALVQTAQEYVDLNRNCIEACLRKLSLLLEQEEQRLQDSHSSRSTAPIPTLPLTVSKELSTININPSSLSELSSSLSSSSSSSSTPTSTTLSSCTSSQPISGEYESYIVKPFDTLAAIALTFNMNKEELRILNKIHHSGQLLPGQVILVRKTKPKPQPPSTTTKSANTTLTSRRESISTTGTSTLVNTIKRETLPVTQNSKFPKNSPTQRIYSRDDTDIDRTSFFTIDTNKKVSSGKSLFKGLLRQLPEEAFFNKQFIRKAKVKLLEMEGTSFQYIAGVLTATNIQFIFEPDLDDPAVRQRGVLHYTISFDLNKIVGCDLVNIDNPQLNTEQSGEILFTDDAHANAILQVCTEEVHQPTGGKIHHFLTTRLQAKELSRYIEQHITHSREKTLIESLNLDSSIPKLASRFSQKMNSLSEVLHLKTMHLSRHSKKDGKQQQQQKQEQKGWLKYIRELTLRSRSSYKKQTKEKQKSPRNYSNQNSIMASLFGVTWEQSETALMEASSSSQPSNTQVNSNRGVAQTQEITEKQQTKSTKNREDTKNRISKTIEGGHSQDKNDKVETNTFFKGNHNNDDDNEDDDNSENSDEEEVPNLLDKSNLLTRDSLELLREYFPNRYRSMDWKRIFCTDIHGTSLITFYSRVRDKAPTLVIIQDDYGSVFGGYASEPWAAHPNFFGTGECFLFTLKPQFNAYKWTKANNLFMYAQRDGIAMGGGQLGNFGFWIDGEFNCGTSGVSKTFLNRRLSNTEEFKCTVVETWTPVPKKI